MRRIVSFPCDDATLIGTVDEANATTGLLIVSGGNEIRIGAHRGMALLAKDIAAAGHPVFRFDRRGIGDSEGQNGGFQSSKADFDAGLAAFKSECPHLSRIVAFGNCDAASALVLHQTKVDALIIANPWVIEPTDDLPPSAAIKDRYAKRLRDPKAWIALFSGKLNIAAAFRGLRRIAAPATPARGLVAQVAAAIATDTRPTRIIAATGDNTAIAFLDAWQSDGFAAARRRADIDLIKLDSTSHSFAGDDDYAALKSMLLAALSLRSATFPITGIGLPKKRR
jgi:exosortase A-associated hydrolase 1